MWFSAEDFKKLMTAISVAFLTGVAMFLYGGFDLDLSSSHVNTQVNLGDLGTTEGALKASVIGGLGWLADQ